MMVLGLMCCTMACPIEHNFMSLCLEVNNFVRKYVKVEGICLLSDDNSISLAVG